MTTTLAGATFRQTELLEMYSSTKGRPFSVTLREEPDNPHDSDAIAVYYESNIMLGYVPRSAQEVWTHRTKDKTVKCQIDYWQAKNLYLARIN